MFFQNRFYSNLRSYTGGALSRLSESGQAVRNYFIVDIRLSRRRAGLSARQAGENFAARGIMCTPRQAHPPASGGARGGRNGFTLIEILTALAIVSIASSLFISMFASSVALAKMSRCRRIAVHVAEAQLSDLLLDAGRYDWPRIDELEVDEWVPVRPALPVGRQAAGPGTPVLLSYLPQCADARSDRRDKALYKRFSCETFACIPRKGALYFEVIAVVRWTHAGNEHVYVLTSCVPRDALEVRQ